MRRLADREEGASLVLALVFLTVFGLFVPVLLASVETHLKVNTVVLAAEAKLYGADGGIEYAIQKLRTDSNLCPTAAAGPTDLDPITINGRTVNVRCEATEGHSGVGPIVTNGYSIITTGVGDDKSIQRLGPEDVIVSGGHVFVAGSLMLRPPGKLRVTEGNVLHKNPYCNAPDSGLIVSAPFTHQCTADPVPDPPVDLPAAPPPGPQPTTETITLANGERCQIFYPGTYTSKQDVVEKRAYFASGIYYFNFNNKWAIPDAQIVGGTPSSGETSDPSMNLVPCATDAVALAQRPSAPVSGTGVLWIFGGPSSLEVKDDKAAIELFSRVAPSGSPEGTDGVSIYAVRAPCPTPTVPPCSTGPWTPWTNASGDVFFMESGPQVSLHGTLYAWNSPIEFHGPKDTVRLRGGVAARRLRIQTNAAGAGSLVITVGPPPPSTRTVRVTARAQGTTPGEAETVIRAMVQIIPAAPGTYDASVYSWRKCDGCP